MVRMENAARVPDVTRRVPLTIDRARRGRHVVGIIVGLMEAEHAIGDADHTTDDAAKDAADHGSHGRSRRSGDVVADRDPLLRAPDYSLRLDAQRECERAGKDAGQQGHLVHLYFPISFDRRGSQTSAARARLERGHCVAACGQEQEPSTAWPPILRTR
jgi:hypothetical protein